MIPVHAACAESSVLSLMRIFQSIYSNIYSYKFILTTFYYCEFIFNFWDVSECFCCHYIIWIIYSYLFILPLFLVTNVHTQPVVVTATSNTSSPTRAPSPITTLTLLHTSVLASLTTVDCISSDATVSNYIDNIWHTILLMLCSPWQIIFSTIVLCAWLESLS